MFETKLEVHDELNKQAEKLRYLAEKEDKSGLSEILIDIARSVSFLKHAECLQIKEDEDVKAD